GRFTTRVRTEANANLWSTRFERSGLLLRPVVAFVRYPAPANTEELERPPAERLRGDDGSPVPNLHEPRLAGHHDVILRNRATGPERRPHGLETGRPGFGPVLQCRRAVDRDAAASPVVLIHQQASP